ncbi:hypothetical protein RHMOL_Rhmol05G0120600 [Rhododendron molle]|uniref:Uncharacterized protein n=1 Tax=Rhododendron molle TaxID=49168 RepID=A0ACC0NPJ4_RHOML|nr:hypothetical protein RHMOL_Rhmol05G0120600 [Rhododendron molle]
MAPPKKKTKGNVVDVDCRNEELKEMDEECRNEVPKHPRNAWISFYQEQCKLKDDVSLKSMSMEEISEKWKALGDHARQKYKKKSIKSSEKYKEDKIKLDLPKAPKNTFISRTQLKAAYDRMQELDPLQVESVKAMGFGGLHNYTTRCEPHLGLPCGGQKVILKGEYTEIHELCLRHEVGDQGSISFDHLHNYLMNNKKDDDDFKVSFLLYIMGTILCPTSEFGVNKRFLHALKDLSSVRKLDWSQFVLKFLAEGIQKYQKGRKVIRGCLLFLMLFYLEHCTPAEYFTSRCGMRPSRHLSAWEDKDIGERACWFNKTSKRKGEKVKVIIEDGVGKRERMMNQGKEVDHDKSMENDQVKNLTSMVERMSSLLEETLDAMHEKDRKRKYSATNGGINKDTPSALEEPDVEGHFKTKKAKCTENALSGQMTSPLKTNKEKGKEEAKLNASSKRLRKMTANVREALSRTAPAIDGKNKWENKLKTNRFDKSQRLKRNANKLKFSSAEGRIGLVLDLIMFKGIMSRTRLWRRLKRNIPALKGKTDDIV